ncbi:hypothetical protein QNI19_36025 [Cytophagaceae bacterium DM2B3-1]|uniref:DUF3885 domain-containing protein n=1 Tax=Xanthocytophaga flava TaxID=3048013 RepID=A0ABT7D0S4_9BACT|nr:hypothetical protein [Xanthocytophaga flavus]MDJ1498399.1 hypothetical protein [Xanthocytophaga flavus]
MDTFRLRFSIQKLVPSKAYLQAGKPHDMWTSQYIKWRFVKEKDANQSIESFLEELTELKKDTKHDFMLRIEYIINGKYLDQMIKYSDSKCLYDLFFSGKFNSFEFVELQKAYNWGLFLIKRFMGEPLIIEDVYQLYYPHIQKEPFPENERVRKVFLEEQECGVQIYCCGACADRLCGSWDIDIIRRGNTIMWDLGYLGKFYFDLDSYQQELMEYKSYLERKVNKPANT